MGLLEIKILLPGRTSSSKNYFCRTPMEQWNWRRLEGRVWQYTYCRTFSHICRNDSERQQYHVTDVGLKDGASSPFLLIWIKTRHFLFQVVDTGTKMFILLLIILVETLPLQSRIWFAKSGVNHLCSSDSFMWACGCYYVSPEHDNKNFKFEYLQYFCRGKNEPWVGMTKILNF